MSLNLLSVPDRVFPVEFARGLKTSSILDQRFWVNLTRTMLTKGLQAERLAVGSLNKNKFCPASVQEEESLRGS